MFLIDENILNPVKRIPFSIEAIREVIRGEFLRHPFKLSGSDALAISSSLDSGMLVNVPFYAVSKITVYGPVIVLESGESL